MDKAQTHREVVDLCDACANRFINTEEGHTLSRRHDDRPDATFCAVCRHRGHRWTIESASGD